MEVRSEHNKQKLFPHTQRNFFPGIIAWGVHGVLLLAPMRGPTHSSVLAQLQDHRRGDEDECQYSAQTHLRSR